MGLFSSIFRGGTRQRLEARVRSAEAGQEEFLGLAELLREEGEPAEALKILRAGTARYPDSAPLRRRLAELDSAERAAQKERLRQQVANTPNPVLYGRLAELYRLDGQRDECLAVCQAALHLFPNHGGIHYTQAQVYLADGEGTRARQELEQAVAAESYNYQALRLLAETCLRLGDPAAAARHCEALLLFAAGDREVTELLEQARRAQAEAGPPLAAEPVEEESAADAPLGALEGEVAGAPRDAERDTTRDTTRGADETKVIPLDEVPAAAVAAAVAAAASRASRAPGVPGAPVAPAAGGLTATKIISRSAMGALAPALGRFLKIVGVRAVVLVDLNGLLIGVESGEGINAGEELAGALVTSIARSADRATQQMGLGPLAEALIEGTGTNLHVRAFGDMLLGVFAGREIMPGRLEREVGTFIDEALGRT